MELKSNSVVSLRFVSIGHQWTIIAVLSVGGASGDVFVSSGMFVKVNG